MPKADLAYTITRRSLLAVAPTSLLLAGRPAVVPGHPDLDLLRLCGEFDAIERHVNSFFYGPLAIEDDQQRDGAIEPWRDRQDELLDQIEAASATTLDGMIARVRTLVLYDASALTVQDGTYPDRMGVAIIRDLARMDGITEAGSRLASVG